MRAISSSREAVGLEIGEAPVGIAEVRPGGRGRAGRPRWPPAAGRASSARARSTGADRARVACGASASSSRYRPMIARSCSPRPTQAVAYSVRYSRLSDRAPAASSSLLRAPAAYLCRSIQRTGVVVARGPVVGRQLAAPLRAAARHHRARRARCRSAPAGAWPRRDRRASAEGADDVLGRREVAVGEQAAWPARPRGGRLCSVATCAAAVAAFFASPVMRYRPSSMLQLAGSAGLMFTARRKASIARGASRSAT